MPRGKKETTPAVQSKGVIGVRKIRKDDEWGGYVQCSIGDSQRERYEMWLSETDDHVSALLADSLAVGLKLTAVWDGSNQCFIATLTGRPDINGESAFTCSLSARGGDLWESINVLLYKHFEMCGEDWTEWLVNGSRTRRSFG